jgi:hypothetical protein
MIPGSPPGKHYQNVAGEMLSQSHDKKVDAMHKQFEQAQE